MRVPFSHKPSNKNSTTLYLIRWQYTTRPAAILKRPEKSWSVMEQKITTIYGQT